MDERVKWTTTGLILGGIAGSAVVILKHILTDDDRPPIKVRGGSVTVEKHPPRGKARAPEWQKVPAQDAWRSKQRAVGKLDIAITNPAVGPDVENLPGQDLELLHTHQDERGETEEKRLFIRVDATNKYLLVGPLADFSLDPNNSGARRLLFQTPGNLIEVKVDDAVYYLDDKSEIWIWPRS